MKKISVRAGKGQSFVGAITGVIFVIVGFVIAIPTFGGFGVIWTLLAAVITVVNLINAFSDRGIATQRIYIEDDNEMSSNSYRTYEAHPVKDSKSRLYDLEELYRQQLISQEEYDAKRKEILKDL